MLIWMVLLWTLGYGYAEWDFETTAAMSFMLIALWQSWFG